MPIDLKFLNDLKKDIIFQNYTNIHVKITSSWLKDKFIILFLKLEYTYDSKKDLELNYSIDKSDKVIKSQSNESDFEPFNI